MTQSAVEVEPGVRLHVGDVGPADAGRPVVLLAGLGLDHKTWTGQVAALRSRHRVVTVDLRGTGRSDAPLAGYSLARLALDVTTVLDHLDLAGVALVGHSFGGQVALLMAATAPERLSRIALVSSNGVRASRSPAFPFGPPAAALETVLARAEREERVPARRRNVLAGFGPAAGSPSAAGPGPDPDPDLVDRLVRSQLRMPPWAAIACFRTYLHTDLTDELAGVKRPVLQILGADDPVTARQGGPWLQERLPDSRLVVLDGCGHYPMFDAPDRFDALLAEFADQI